MACIELTGISLPFLPMYIISEFVKELEREQGVPPEPERVPTECYYVDFVSKGAIHYKKGCKVKYSAKRGMRLLHTEA